MPWPARGAYRVEPFDAQAVGAAREVLECYVDLAIGIADASLAVLSRRHGTLDHLTLDARHFRVLPDAGGRPFRLLTPG